MAYPVGYALKRSIDPDGQFLQFGFHVAEWVPLSLITRVVWLNETPMACRPTESAINRLLARAIHAQRDRRCTIRLLPALWSHIGSQQHLSYQESAILDC